MGNQVVNIENAVKVVGLVLNGLGQRTLGLDALLFAGQVLVAHANPHGPVNHTPVAGQTEAAFLHLAQPFPAYNFRVDQRQRRFPILQLDDAHTLQHADLVGGQANAPVSGHSFRHIGGQPGQLVIKLRYLDCPPTQDRVGK